MIRKLCLGGSLAFIWATGQVVGSEISLTNLALSQKATASSSEEPALAVVDGNQASYWQSAGTVGDHWLQIELDKAKSRRFTAPLAKEGTTFTIIKEGSKVPLYTGKISGEEYTWYAYGKETSGMFIN